MAVTTITCLEELVNVSLAKLDESGKEVTETLNRLNKATRENQVSIHLNKKHNLFRSFQSAFQRVVRFLRTRIRRYSQETCP